MARVHQEGDKYFYEVDDIDIPLNSDTYQAFKHRNPEWKLLDWIGVLDPRDQEHFSHWRYDQDPEAFEQMMGLAELIGTIVVRDEPYDFTQKLFEQRYGLGESEIEEFFGDKT